MQGRQVDVVGGRTLVGLLRQRAELGSDAVLPEGESGFVRWDEIAGAVEQRVARLADHGLQGGQRIAIYRGTALDTFVDMLAVYSLAATAVMANSHYTANELEVLVRDASVAALIVDTDERRRAAAADTVARIGGPDLQELTPTSSVAFLPGGRVDEVVGRTVDAPATLVYTAGSTARPKGVLYSHGHHVFAATTMTTAFGVLPGDLVLHHFPVFHTNGLCQLFTSLVCGTRLLLRERFRSTSFRELVETHEVNFTFLNPTQTRMVLREDHRLERGASAGGSLRYVGTAGIDLESRLEFERVYGATMVECYGSTESIAICCAGPLASPKHGSCGLPTTGFEMKVEPEARLGGPKPGRLYVRSRLRYGGFPGYEGGAEADLLHDESGDWYGTGDLAFQDEDGYFYFAGRGSDVIKRGGETISAFEVEQAIMQHHGVEEVAVVGRADALREQVPVAFVVLRPGVDDGTVLSEVEAMCRSVLAYYKVPETMHIVDDLPRLGTAKVDKVTLRATVNTSS